MVKRRLFKKLAMRFPDLRNRLVQGGLSPDTEAFVRKIFLGSLNMSFFITLILFLLFSDIFFKKFLFLAFFPVTGIFFFYFMNLPDVKAKKREKEINQEIVFAGRFMIIELESGVPLYQIFRDVIVNYPLIGKYFMEVTRDVDLGNSMDEAIHKVIETTPSRSFRNLLWQVLNSITTGADMVVSLRTVIEQITREQSIELQEYGRKLNPLAMFFMITAVILPSIGIAILVIFASFMGLQLNMTFFLVLAGGMGVVQFFFYTIIKSSRPAGQFS